jgi:hypothetical protein
VTEQEISELRDTVGAQAMIIQEMGEHLALLRTVLLYTLMQASIDEVDQTEHGNPWLKLRKDFVATMNPHIRKLNAMLGVKAEDQQQPAKIAVVTK